MAAKPQVKWFIQAPACMAFDPKLSHTAMRLALVLMHYKSMEKGCYPSQQTLAIHLSCSVDTVQRYLLELELYGFLVCEKQRGISNRYRLNPLYKPTPLGQRDRKNADPARPPSPRTLRRRLTPATIDAEFVPNEEPTAPVRPVTLDGPAEVAAPVRCEVAARVRSGVAAPVRKAEPHECGPIKNHGTNNQQQQDAAASLKRQNEIDIEAGLIGKGFNSELAAKWAADHADLDAPGVIRAACRMRLKPGYNLGEIREPSAYIRTLVAVEVRECEAAERERRERPARIDAATVRHESARRRFAALSVDEQARLEVRVRRELGAGPEDIQWPAAISKVFDADDASPVIERARGLRTVGGAV